MAERNRQQIIEYVRKSLTYTLFDVKWVPSSARFVGVGNYARNTGCIFIYQIESGELQVVKEVEKSQPFKCCTFGQSPEEERHLATGNFKGQLQVWDIEDFGVPLFDVAAHESIINTIDGCLATGPPELVTGSRDGSVKVWDVRQKHQPVAHLQPANPETKRDCWAVAFGNSFNRSERVVAAGYDNGDIKMFDLRTNKLRWQTNTGNGICHLDFDRADIEMNKLVVSTLEGRIRVYDLRTFHPTIGYSHLEERVHSGTVWCSKSLPQNRDIFATAGNGEIALHK
eukprot:TRINITY_DN28290_c0_g1_i1.p1 TRINITY_DN28290_c0_g1~~TRINITY_DN28290_c0_g1_i1.p1  ORF type:complete len:284 (+),score=67.43 TRINITY_DN28290_c0_g1_i1:75-926(+)